MNSFCKTKDSVKITKWQPTEWEKIFSNLTSDRSGLQNKEFKKLDINKPNNPIKN